MKFLYDQFNLPFPYQKETDEEDYFELYKPTLSMSSLTDLVEFYKDDFSTFGYNADRYFK